MKKNILAIAVAATAATTVSPVAPEACSTTASFQIRQPIPGGGKAVAGFDHTFGQRKETEGKKVLSE